jgi:hypothetical protein
MRIASHLIALAALLLGSLPVLAYEPVTAPAPRPLQYPDDTFAFKNETVWNYIGGTVQPETPETRARQYTQRCFVLSRSIVQFWKFARFDPSLPPLNAADLATRIRQVTGRSVWLPAFSPQDRIVIPGYHNLHEASARMAYVFQANLGLGWPFYFRPGNGVIAMWVTRALEDRLNGEIYHDLQMNTPSILWVYRFPSLKMNHVIVVYSGTHDASGYHYHVYDPNYRDRFSHLEYDPKTRTFSFQKVYFFKGGPVTARSIYRGLLQ